jgi:hypothetical protein
VSSFEAWIRQETSIRQDQPSAEIKPVITNTLEATNGSEAKNPAGVVVSFVQGPQVRVGQKVQIRVTAREAGYLMLLDVLPDGSITQIYPNRASLRSPTGTRLSSVRLDPRRPLVVPDPANPYAGFEYVVDPPAGDGILVAVLSDKPMNWLSEPETPRTFSTRADALGFVARLGELMARDMTVEPRDKPRRSIAVAPYVIMR